MNQAPSPSLKQTKEAAFLEWDMAQKALDNGDSELAWLHLKQALTRLSSITLDHSYNDLLVSVTLDFSNLCFALGKGLNTSVSYLRKAKSAAERLGDRRSRALIFMHLGRFYYFAEAIHEALAIFAEGKSEIEKLGDEDILSQSAEFLGFYFHIQGLFMEALPHFERAAKTYESGGKIYGSGGKGMIVNPSGPMSLAYCYTFLGRFHQAIGTLDYYRRLALERSDRSLATTMRAVLGMVLLMINKREEAHYHLTGALQEAIKAKNDLAYYFATGYLSYYEFLEGRPHESWKLFLKNTRHVKKAGLIQLNASALALEHHYEFNRLGLRPIPGFNYHEEIKRHLQGPNIQLQGVALRLRAMDAASKGEDSEVVEAELRTSEEILRRTGDPIQLANGIALASA